MRGNVERKSDSIALLDRQGSEMARWTFFNAWPAGYDGPDLNASGNDVAVETLGLAREGVERLSPGSAAPPSNPQPPVRDLVEHSRRIPLSQAGGEDLRRIT